MGRREILVGSALLVLLGALVWVLLTTRLRARPGNVTFVLVDESGKAIEDVVARFEVDGDDQGGFDLFDVKAGTHTVIVWPIAPHFPGTRELDFKPFTRTLAVSGARLHETQRVEVTVPGALRYRLTEELREELVPEMNHTLEVEVSWPDGSPAAGVVVRCWAQDAITDGRGRARFGPTWPGPVSV